MAVPYVSLAPVVRGKARQFLSAKTPRSEVSEKVSAAASQRYAGTKIKYNGKPLGRVQVVSYFLPSPAELAFSEKKGGVIDRRNGDRGESDAGFE